jgi:hypothetical protein
MRPIQAKLALLSVARVDGIAFVGLGIASWPAPLVGMLIYSALVIQVSQPA